MSNGISGRAGSADFANTKNGTLMKAKSRPNNPNTPAQQAVREDLSQVTRTYSTLTDDQLDEWRDYAKNNPRSSKRTRSKRPLSAINVFTALSTKFLQINPGGTPPVTPPAATFTGDTVTVTAEGKEGSVLFTASHANSEGVKTELLLQKLPSRARVPTKTGYRSKAFVAFATGTLTHSVTARKGWYAPAMRFVNRATGEEMGIVSLPLVQVT